MAKYECWVHGEVIYKWCKVMALHISGHSESVCVCVFAEWREMENKLKAEIEEKKPPTESPDVKVKWLFGEAHRALQWSFTPVH